MVDPLHYYALGTAQLGMAYGVANRGGKPELKTARSIIEAAWETGVSIFDTAQAYGSSETVLGACLKDLGCQSSARVITKLDPGLDVNNAEAIYQSVQDSLRRLGLEHLYGLFLHREEWLDALDSSLGEVLERLLQDRLVQNIGVSVYNVGRARQAIASRFITAIQIPGNIYDRRLLRAGVIANAAQSEVEIFVRSVYLQGLAVLRPADVPKEIPHAQKAVCAFEEFCTAHDLRRPQFALQYASHIFKPGILVIGAETPDQVRDNSYMLQSARIHEDLFEKWNHIWPEDIPDLINPSTWRTKTNQ